MESLKDMVDVNTVVGEPVETQDGAVIVPVSRVAFGFAAGGGEYNTALPPRVNDGNGGGNNFPFAGGSGAGVAVSPVGFLVVGHGNVKLLSVENSAVDKLLDAAPQMMDKVQGMIGQAGKGSSSSKGTSGGGATAAPAGIPTGGRDVDCDNPNPGSAGTSSTGYKV